MNGIADYVVLDDIIEDLADCVKSKMKFRRVAVDTKELLRPLEEWEMNPRCSRSIKYHHHKS